MVTITVIPPVKCKLCSSTRIMNIGSAKKRQGHFCEDCRVFESFGDKMFYKVVSIKKIDKQFDFIMKSDLVLGKKRKAG